MKKILATVVKEWILMRRDIAGMTLLLLMPAVLIVVMSVIEDMPFRDYQEMRFDLLVADNDGGQFSREILSALKKSNNFHVIDSINGQQLTATSLKKAIKNGKYRIGIVVPQGCTAEMINAANTIANTVSSKIGLGTLPSRAARNDLSIKMYFDPTAKPAFRMSVSFALDKYISLSSQKMLMQRLSHLATSSASSNQTDTTATPENIFKGIPIEQMALNEQTRQTTLNSVQHNVPAWAIFGMFFIVVPIAGHLIREKEERSTLRLALIPNALHWVGIGKIAFYVIVCTVQFAVMMLLGVFMMPVIGLPALSMGIHPLAIIPLAVCISLAATSYGYFIGTVFRTTNQALPFGAISVVIFSAMGGIWVPIDVLSPVAQKLAMASPMQWALDGLQQILLRNLGLKEVFPHIFYLIAFSTLLWVASSLINRKRYNNVM